MAKILLIAAALAASVAAQPYGIEMEYPNGLLFASEDGSSTLGSIMPTAYGGFDMTTKLNVPQAATAQVDIADAYGVKGKVDVTNGAMQVSFMDSYGAVASSIAQNGLNHLVAKTEALSFYTPANAHSSTFTFKPSAVDAYGNFKFLSGITINPSRHIYFPALDQYGVEIPNFARVSARGRNGLFFEADRFEFAHRSGGTPSGTLAMDPYGFTVQGEFRMDNPEVTSGNKLVLRAPSGERPSVEGTAGGFKYTGSSNFMVEFDIYGAPSATRFNTDQYGTTVWGDFRMIKPEVSVGPLKFKAASGQEHFAAATATGLKFTTPKLEFDYADGVASAGAIRFDGYGMFLDGRTTIAEPVLPTGRVVSFYGPSGQTNWGLIGGNTGTIPGVYLRGDEIGIQTATGSRAATFSVDGYGIGIAEEFRPSQVRVPAGGFVSFDDDAGGNEARMSYDAATSTFKFSHRIDAPGAAALLNDESVAAQVEAEVTRQLAPTLDLVRTLQEQVTLLKAEIGALRKERS